MTREEQQYKKMTETPTKKLVLTLGIPTTISMLVTAIYNIADTFFVSKLGTSASGAVGIVFSLTAIIQAIGFTFGTGASSAISSKLGEKKEHEAQEIASSSFYIAVVMGLIFSIFSFIFIKPLMKGLGATETILPYAIDYASVIIFGFPIMVGSFVLNNILRSEGKAKLAMIGLTIGGVINIFLDPLFIHVFNLGIKGAAIATIISQSIGLCILLSMFILKKCIIKLSIFDISKHISVYLEVIKIGLPSLFRQGLASLTTIVLNKQAGKYGGDAALSAMTIAGKVFFVIFSTLLGIGQGYQPVCGYNYFAKKYGRVKEAMIFTLISGTTLMTGLGVIFFFVANKLMAAFIPDDMEVIKIGTTVLRYQCISLPFIGLNVVTNMSFQSTKKKFKAVLLSSCRQGLFLLPLIYFLPMILESVNGNGLLGVELSQALSDGLAFLFTIPFFISFIKELKKLQKEQENTNTVLSE